MDVLPDFNPGNRFSSKTTSHGSLAEDFPIHAYYVNKLTPEQ